MPDEISALGRPFKLGMIYDRRSEKLVFKKTLWSYQHLNKAVTTDRQPYTNSDVFVESSIDDKINALNIEAVLKLVF